MWLNVLRGCFPANGYESLEVFSALAFDSLLRRILNSVGVVLKHLTLMSIEKLAGFFCTAGRPHKLKQIPYLLSALSSNKSFSNIKGIKDIHFAFSRSLFNLCFPLIERVQRSASSVQAHSENRVFVAMKRLTQRCTFPLLMVGQCQRTCQSESESM